MFALFVDGNMMRANMGNGKISQMTSNAQNANLKKIFLKKKLNNRVIDSIFG